MKKKKGNILSVEEGIVAHGVNCRGVMGAGLAKQIREKWPHVYDEYRISCNEYSPKLIGSCQFVNVKDNLVIANCFTQINYGRRDGCYTNFLRGVFPSLATAIGKSVNENLPLNIPAIGCGFGGGEIEDLFKIVNFLEDWYETEITYWEYE